jgi:uncharacterized protein (TIGR03083 family)
MDNSRFLACLEADYRRMREVVPGHLSARVATCPDWTVADLTRHVGEVYLHKVECMRSGGTKETEWPPAGLKDEEPVALLDRAYGELLTELTTRDPADLGGTWYPPDPTVGFWFRRMAQETVIHRIDAELATGAAIVPIPDDLAVDGTDELLKVFVGYAVDAWGDYFTEALSDSPGRAFKIQTVATADRSSVTWIIRTSPGRFAVDGGPAEQPAEDSVADVTVSGTPTDVLRWSWNRETPGEPSRVTVDGSEEALAEFGRCVVIATQ